MSAKSQVVVLRRLLAAGLCAVLAASDGCQTKSTPTATVSPPVSQPTLPAVSPDSSPPVAAAANGDRETWDVYTIKGVRVGYGHGTLRHATKDGRDVVLGTGFIHMDVKRFGQPTVEDIKYCSTETPDGQLLNFQSENRLGATPLWCSGQVRGDRLEIRTSTSGKPLSASIPWSADYGGFFAVEESLLRQPMKPGEKRTVYALDISNLAIPTDLTARGPERVKLLAGSSDLLRVDLVLRWPGGRTMQGALWTDRSGEVLKDRLDAMEIETFRVSKEVALAEIGSRLDLGDDALVKVDRPLPEAHQRSQIRYRVELAGGDPARYFVSGPSQRVKSMGPHTAEITVYAIRPGREDGNRQAAADPPGLAALQPNNFIQSDDAKIVADAKEAAGGQTDSWKVAVALEQYVYRVVKPDFNAAFATASDVARSRKGDCKGHAVYLAALARARGIPARVASGLVYVEGARAFGDHMWTEVYVGNRWIPLDGMLGKGGIGAGHLKLGQSTLEGVSAFGDFTSEAETADRLKIEVLDAQ